MQQCKQCNLKFETLDKLRRHSSRVHKISSQETYNEYVLNNNIPTCKCGCGENPNFISFTYGYNEWIKGHIARVENNWGHNQRAIHNSSKTRKDQFKRGERRVWNNGLTKEESKSLKIAGEKISNAFNHIRKKEYSSRMQKLRLDGTIPTKFGKESPNWKGGTSSINNLVRANKRLYEHWIYPILNEQNFSCQECGFTKKLEIHHNNETMSEILQKFTDKENEYTFDQKKDIMNCVIDYHIDNKVSGITLCKKCHKKLHPSYNY